MNEENTQIVITEQDGLDEERELMPGRRPIIPAGNQPASSDQQAYNPLDLPSEVFNANLERRKHNRSSFVTWVRSALVENVDYGKVWLKKRNQWSKNSLRKAGAEKICGMLGVTAHFPTLPDYERSALSCVNFEHIILRCELKEASGRVVADGVGARSLSQDYGDLNKALKMAEKSAMIDATLRMGGLSEIFTQDIEDMKQEQSQPVTDKINDKQIREMETLLGEADGDLRKFCAYFNVNDINDLTQEKFAAGSAMLKKKIAKKGTIVPL